MIGAVTTLRMKSEVEVLILCARTVMADEQKVQIRSLAENGLDWDELVRLTKQHGVTSLVYWNLNAVCPELIPSDVLLFLRQHFQANAARAHLLTQELVQLTKAAEDSGVSLIPFKGPTLAAMAYGNVFLRDFRDMDLIIARDSIHKIYEVFEGQEYQTLDSGRSTEINNLSSKRYHHFVKAHGNVRVDLQWVMGGSEFSFQLDRPSILNNLQPVQLHDAQIMGLATEELLLILCVHGSKHVWEELKWVCDVAELIRAQENIDWKKVLVLAQEWRCRRMLFLGLALTQILFNVTLPEFLRQQIFSDGVVEILVKNIQRSLTEPAHAIGENEYQAYYFHFKDHWTDRWLYGLHLCRMDSPVITKDLPWFKSQRSLFLLSRVFSPIRFMTRKVNEFCHLKKLSCSG